MPPEPEVLSNYLQSNYPGVDYYSAYEAGFSGLWTHHRLCNPGVNNIVVNAADIPGSLKGLCPGKRESKLDKEIYR